MGGSFILPKSFIRGKTRPLLENIKLTIYNNANARRPFDTIWFSHKRLANCWP